MSEHSTLGQIEFSNQRERELKMARELEREREASLKTIDVIMEVGKHELGYKKKPETEEIKAKDCSDSIELQTHEVLKSGYYHTSIRITPKGEEYKDDPRFKQVDEAGRHYTTLGAGPVKNRLKADVDRSNDIGPHPNRIPLGLKNCDNEMMLIENILDKNSKFTQGIDYDLLPADEKNRSWYWPDDSHNSNSFISGLIDAAHLKKPVIDTEVHPGWNQPVSIEYFRGTLSYDDFYRFMPGIKTEAEREKAIKLSERNAAQNEYEEKFLFDKLYKNDSVTNSDSQSEKEEYYNKMLKLKECQVSNNREVCVSNLLGYPTIHNSSEAGFQVIAPIPVVYHNYKKESAWRQYSEEKNAMLRECEASNNREMCEKQNTKKSYETFSIEYDIPASKRSEAIKEVFDKIDEFKKSDVFKFIENQVEGVTKILPKL